ncbi:hypothetical protein [Streptomyces sp. NPDC017890]|uniref:hypothetical protein n=1 Tax=Streptomyces sp. NPDC017890 TaxID=3365015 RepID=UPI0037961A0D
MGWVGWEGISALVAAAAVLVALIVGQWQRSGAQRAAEAASRAGISQAEAAYRAALDAVKATSAESHSQWLRGVRRETYSAFLLSCSRALRLAEQLSYDTTNNKIPPAQRDARAAELEAALDDLAHNVVITQLEGPEQIGQRAEDLSTALREATVEHARIAELYEAWADLKRLVEENPDSSVTDFYHACLGLMVIAHYDVSAVPADALDVHIRMALEHVEETHERLSFFHSFDSYTAKCHALGEHYTARDRCRDHTRHLDVMRREFLEAVRDVLATR